MRNGENPSDPPNGFAGWWQGSNIRSLTAWAGSLVRRQGTRQFELVPVSELTTLLFNASIQASLRGSPLFSGPASGKQGLHFLQSKHLGTDLSLR